MDKRKQREMCWKIKVIHFLSILCVDNDIKLDAEEWFHEKYKE